MTLDRESLELLARAARAFADVLDPPPRWDLGSQALDVVCPSCDAEVGIWCVGVAEGSVHREAVTIHANSTDAS